jgi:hypothetical protein
MGIEMRILVCGGRDFRDYDLLSSVLRNIIMSVGSFPVTIIHGGARGADALAGQYARRTACNERVFPANWAKYGRAAGFRRNAEMLKEGVPHMVVAFPGGRGTADMVKRAKAAGVPVHEVLVDATP